MASLVRGPPSRHVPEMGGPEALSFAEIARKYFRAVGKRRVVFEVPLPGKAAKAFAAGYNLAPDHCDGRSTWDDFLARLPCRRRPPRAPPRRRRPSAWLAPPSPRAPEGESITREDTPP